MLVRSQPKAAHIAEPLKHANHAIREVNIEDRSPRSFDATSARAGREDRRRRTFHDSSHIESPKDDEERILKRALFGWASVVGK